LVFYSSNFAMMYVPIKIRSFGWLDREKDAVPNNCSNSALTYTVDRFHVHESTRPVSQNIKKFNAVHPEK